MKIWKFYEDLLESNLENIKWTLLSVCVIERANNKKKSHLVFENVEIEFSHTTATTAPVDHKTIKENKNHKTILTPLDFSEHEVFIRGYSNWPTEKHFQSRNIGDLVDVTDRDKYCAKYRVSYAFLVCLPWNITVTLACQSS